MIDPEDGSIESAESAIENSGRPEQSRKPGGKRVRAGWFGLAAGVILLVLAVMNMHSRQRSLRERDDPLSVQINDVKTHLYLTALDIDSYRHRNGTYPDSLWEEDVVEYTLESDGSYTLSYSLQDTVIVYNSRNSRNELLTEEFLGEVLRESPQTQ